MTFWQRYSTPCWLMTQLAGTLVIGSLSPAMRRTVTFGPLRKLITFTSPASAVNLRHPAFAG